MKITVLLGALLCVLTIHAADARVRAGHNRAEPGNQVGCADPIMRPCDNSAAKYNLKYNRSFGHHPKRLKRLANHSGNDHFVTTPATRITFGLSRVLAEGAGRAVNWIKPRAWCGWWMRKHLGVANPAANVARWWAGYGRPAHGPHVGAIVVWRHHVGRITGRTADGRWIVKSGNDGHRVRERPRSVAGAIAFRWPV